MRGLLLGRSASALERHDVVLGFSGTLNVSADEPDHASGFAIDRPQVLHHFLRRLTKRLERLS
jgi:hypothetical protein